MMPRSSSLCTRSAAEGAERRKCWPSSAQEARPLLIRKDRAFISKESVEISLLIIGVDIISPSINNTTSFRNMESNEYAHFVQRTDRSTRLSGRILARVHSSAQQRCRCDG